jgi:hypothetical protein
MRFLLWQEVKTIILAVKLGALEITKILIKCEDSDIEVTDQHGLYKGLTPLSITIHLFLNDKNDEEMSENYFQIILELLKNGANPNVSYWGKCFCVFL